MNGFTDSQYPVSISVRGAGNISDGEYVVDGEAMRDTPWGILVTLNGTRYGIPWGHIGNIQQQQPAPEESVPPTPVQV